MTEMEIKIKNVKMELRDCKSEYRRRDLQKYWMRLIKEQKMARKNEHKSDVFK